MSERIEKKGGTGGEKKCTERVIDSPISVTAFELRRLADILQALAEAAEVGSPFGARQIDPVPQKRIVRFRVCDLKIIDTFSEKDEPGQEEVVLRVSGCEMIPNRLTRGRSYCLCNDAKDTMHVQLFCPEISPDDFVLAPGATIAISVAYQEKPRGTKWYDYKISRVGEGGIETVCSDTGGPKLGIDDPPG